MVPSHFLSFLSLILVRNAQWWFCCSYKCNLQTLLCLLTHSVSQRGMETASWDTPPSFQTEMHINNHSNKRTGTKVKQSPVHKDTCRKANSPSCGWAMDLGLGSMKRGTISCLSASKKSTQGTRANNFSTQIVYSNYARLFNLAACLQALFQVPSKEFVLERSGLGGHLSPHYIILSIMSDRGSTAGVYFMDSNYEFGLTHYPATTALGVIKCPSFREKVSKQGRGDQ